jgi:hypothetical protein
MFNLFHATVTNPFYGFPWDQFARWVLARLLESA